MRASDALAIAQREAQRIIIAGDDAPAPDACIAAQLQRGGASAQRPDARIIDHVRKSTIEVERYERTCLNDPAGAGFVGHEIDRKAIARQYEADTADLTDRAWSRHDPIVVRPFRVRAIAGAESERDTIGARLLFGLLRKGGRSRQQSGQQNKRAHPRLVPCSVDYGGGTRDCALCSRP